MDINSIENGNMNYWIVKLGKLYYACGLPRLAKDYDNVLGYDLVNTENLAFPFIIENSANMIADEIAGTVIKKEGVVKDVAILGDKNNLYISSGDEWYSEQRQQFKVLNE